MSKSKGLSSPSNKHSKNSGLPYEDFMVLLFVGGFLLIDFLPYFKSIEIIAPQFLYLTILNVVAGLYIYSNESLHHRSLLTIFKRSYIFIAFITFTLLSSISIFSAKNVSLGIVSIAEVFVVIAMFVNFAILFSNRLHLLIKTAFLVGASAFFQAGTVLYNLDAIAKSTSLLAALNSSVLKGNAGNINILAASLLFKIPFLYFGIVNFSNWKKWFLSTALLFAVTIIFLISARASLLSLIIVSLIFLGYYVKVNWQNKKSFSGLLYIVFPIVFAFGITNYLFQQSKLDARFVSTAERLATLNAEDGSINRRLIFYRAAINMVKENPVTGIGLGNYRVESIPHDLSTNASVPLHVHNDFLELAAETGILNGLLYFSIFVALLFVNLKRLIRTKEVRVRNIALLTLLLLMIYGIDALINFPFYRPTMQLCFSFLMAFTFVNVGEQTDGKVVVDKRVWLALVMFCASPLYVTYHAYKTSNLEYLIQTDNINFASSGVLKGNDVISRNPKIPNVFQSSESFVEYAGIYYLREKKYDIAIKLLDSANKINPYLGRPEFYKYVIANERGMADSAYFYAKSAFYRRPVNDNFYETAVTLATRLGDTAAVLKMYHTFPNVRTKPNSWAKAYLALNAAGYSKKGLEQFKQLAFKSYPKDTTVQKAINQTAITELIVRGQALFAASKHTEALNSYQQGLKIDSANVYVNQNIGFYYFNLAKPALALPYFLKALSKPGLTGGKTEFFVGLCYINVGDKENACKYFKLAGSYPDAEKLLATHCK